jgi:hypothetical protein
MLGNDVVDLRDVDSRPESFRSRFDARVFTKEELRAISRDRNTRARRFAHWAAKEAAFKLVKQRDSGFVFSPIRLVAEFEPTRTEGGRSLMRRGSVRWTGSARSEFAEVAVRSFETEERVHVVALPLDGDWDAVESAVETIDPDRADASAAVRELAIGEISRSLGVEPHRLSVGRRAANPADWHRNGGAEGSHGIGASRIPSIALDAVETTLSLSLSHHGRFIAYAMAPRFEAPIRGPHLRDARTARPGAEGRRNMNAGAANP